MQRAIRPGQPVEQLDTPVLVIDLNTMERNLDRMMALLDGSGVQLRPHLKTAKSPALAARMVRAGATGICCAKLAEAEVMANAGIADILLTSEVIGAGKFERLVALAAAVPGFKAVVDSSVAVEGIAALARERGLTVRLLIELDVLTGRSGVVTPDEALTLANLIRDTEGVELVGLHGYAGHAQIKPLEQRIELNGAAMNLLDETVELLREHNHNLSIISGGGTGTAALDVQRGLLNEVQAGSFLLMDTAYRDAGVDFENALFCLSTVISRPTPARAVCDAGQKTLTRDGGTPQLTGRPGVTYLRGSDEHGSLGVDPATLDAPLNVGDLVWIIPSHVCTTINLHDQLAGVRDGVVETVFEVSARGCVW
jgi:D-serine deaminase-like pyridoxal phosphate-dependent protein